MWKIVIHFIAHILMPCTYQMILLSGPANGHVHDSTFAGGLLASAWVLWDQQPLPTCRRGHGFGKTVDTAGVMSCQSPIKSRVASPSNRAVAERLQK